MYSNLRVTGESMPGSTGDTASNYSAFSGSCARSSTAEDIRGPKTDSFTSALHAGSTTCIRSVSAGKCFEPVFRNLLSTRTIGARHTLAVCIGPADGSSAETRGLNTVQAGGGVHVSSGSQGARELAARHSSAAGGGTALDDLLRGTHLSHAVEDGSDAASGPGGGDAAPGGLCLVAGARSGGGGLEQSAILVNVTRSAKIEEPAQPSPKAFHTLSCGTRPNWPNPSGALDHKTGVISITRLRATAAATPVQFSTKVIPAAQGGQCTAYWYGSTRSARMWRRWRYCHPVPLAGGGDLIR
jgi:hypothetical protein